MFPNINGSNQAYLAGLARTQSQMNQAQTEISSGLRVQQASDAPASVPAILEVQAQLGLNQQVQTNLGNATTELNTADTVLQSAITAVQNAMSQGVLGATSTATAAQRSSLAREVIALQQTVVGISQTQVNGRYIFSGDQDTGPAYQYDSTQPNGVQQLLTSPATRVIMDSNGTGISVAKTATEIFDTGTAAQGNVFAALNELVVALQNNDLPGINQATIDLKTAGTYLNDQLAFYGVAENRVAAATDLAKKFQTQQTATLSQLRDADVPTVAIQLNQAQLNEQAALSVEAKIISNKNLFSYLG